MSPTNDRVEDGAAPTDPDVRASTSARSDAPSEVTSAAGAAPVAGTAARRARQQERAAQPRGRTTSSKPGAGARGAGAGSGSSVAAERAVARELDPDRLAALEEERDFLLRSLADLEREHDAGDVDDGDYESLKDDYTARAAAVLRAIEARHVTARATRRRRSSGRGWMIALGVLVVGVLAGVAMAQASGRREQGQTLTGDIRSTTREQLFEAQQLFSQGKLLDAVKVYDQVLAAQPANVEAMTYKGWLLRLTANQSANDTDRQTLLAKSLQLLDQAVQTDPGYADARVFRASLLNALDRPEEALADLDAVQPGSVPELLRGLVGQLRTSIEKNIADGGSPSGTTPRGTAPAA
jgi:hypothetical protein